MNAIQIFNGKDANPEQEAIKSESNDHLYNAVNNQGEKHRLPSDHQGVQRYPLPTAIIGSMVNLYSARAIKNYPHPLVSIIVSQLYCILIMYELFG